MDIATLIKEYRTKTGMTQQELADKVFVTVSYTHLTLPTT